MPPKEKDKGVSKKTEKKEQEKVIQDRTFGLKNKNKSKAVQKFVKGVANQVKNANKNLDKEIDAAFEAKKAQKKLEEEQALLTSLYKSVDTVKKAGDEGEEDPKSIVCAYFKQGLCQKGKKCKFSHDLSIEKGSDNIDIYTDQRMQIFDATEDDMSHWDENKLKEVVKTQEGKYKNQKPTEIICKFFLDAVENRRYGWKWLCPNGMSCIYRHCLPPNYVLKRDMISQKGNEDDIALEERLEEERSKITFEKGTKLNIELFSKWKEEKKRKREEEVEKKRKDEIKKVGGKAGALTGRALFEYDKTVFQIDDDDAAELNDYENREEEEENKDENEENNYEADENEVINEEEEDHDEEEETNNKPKEETEKKKEPQEKDKVKINEKLFLNEEDVDF